ncbi:MAG TPA: ABC transporter permease [Streptosporangiaceae bacterium]|nr:ABC transporter permease [Streptosporangiaceae bacterium]
MALAQQVQLHREPGARGDLARRVTGSPALQLVGRRLLTAIPVLLGVTFLTFVVMNLIPGNPAQLILGINASPGAIAKLDTQLGLNHPFWDRYWLWLDGLLHGNLGTAYSNQQSVNSDIAQFLPTTCYLLLYALVVSLGLGVIVAVLAARTPNGIADRLSLAVSMLGLSIAPYVLALVLIYVFAVKVQWFPAISNSLGSNPLQAIRALTLPAASIGFPLFAVYSRLLRADIVEQMQREDYIVTAKAKGVSPWRVLILHATRNSMFTLITLVALNLGTLIGAVAIIEPIFSLPGIGAELIGAIQINDLPLVEGIVVVFALVTVAGNLLADLLYAVLDPRIRYGRSTS